MDIEHHELDPGTVGIFTLGSKRAAYWVRTQAESGYEYFYLSKVANASWVIWDRTLAAGPYTLTKTTSYTSSSIAAFEAAIGYTSQNFDKATLDAQRPFTL